MAPQSSEERYFITKVRSFNGSDFDESDRKIFYPGKDSPNGIGEFIDRLAYDQYIKQTYGKQVETLNIDPNSTDVSDELMLFEVGKTTIQMILAQEGCEGIRLIQIKVKNEDNDGYHKSFIVQGITKERDMDNGGIARAVQGLNGKNEGGTMSQEIHGSSLRQFFRILKGHQEIETRITIDNIIEKLWSGTKKP